jgi:hypothetical protein
MIGNIERVEAMHGHDAAAWASAKLPASRRDILVDLLNFGDRRVNNYSQEVLTTCSHPSHVLNYTHENSFCRQKWVCRRAEAPASLNPRRERPGIVTGALQPKRKIAALSSSPTPEE